MPTYVHDFSLTYVTHVMLPVELPNGRVGLYKALEVDVVALLDVVRVQGGAQTKLDQRRICKNGSFLRRDRDLLKSRFID